MLDATLPVGRIATTHPQALRVFERHGIDYCCGGARVLADVCASRGIEVDLVLAEIAAAVPPVDAPAAAWAEAPLPSLVDHIESRYHRPLERDLERLSFLVRKVTAVHGPQHPELFFPLAEAFEALREDVEPHMRKEETVLFPWIRAGRGDTGAAAVKVLGDEHVAVGAILARLRLLTGDFVAPDDACGSWRALWDGLRELEADLHAHIHLENNVLFPRVLA